MTEELFTLSSDDFESKCGEAFVGWWKDKEFVDVTLAAEDGHQISVHKVVLSSASFSRVCSQRIRTPTH